jgi:hypothetical protein
VVGSETSTRGNFLSRIIFRIFRSWAASFTNMTIRCQDLVSFLFFWCRDQLLECCWSKFLGPNCQS